MTMAGLPVERGTESIVLRAFEKEILKRLRPSKVSVGSVSPQEQGLQDLATYYHSQASCSHRPPLLLSSFRVSMAPNEFCL